MEPHCDSDEEVFIGPVTLKEIRKALTLRRRTEVFETNNVKSREEVKDPPEEKRQMVETTNLTPQPKRQKNDWKRMSCHPRCGSSNIKNSFGSSLHTDYSDEELHVTASPSSSPQDSAEQAEEFEQETPAPPPSPEHSTYLGSPYPTPCNYRRQVSSSLAGIAEEERYPQQQSTPKTPHQKLVIYPRFSGIEKFGGWRDSHAISYTSEVSNSMLSKLDEDLIESVSNLSVSQEVDTRELLIAKMKEHEEKTQKLLCTKKQASNDSDVVLLIEEENDEKLTEESLRNNETTDNEESKPSRFSRLISERNTTSSGLFLGDLERQYGKEKLIELADTQEIPQQSKHVASEYDGSLHSLVENEMCPGRVPDVESVSDKENVIRVLDVEDVIRVSEIKDIERVPDVRSILAKEDVIKVSDVEDVIRVSDVEDVIRVSDVEDVERVSYMVNGERVLDLRNEVCVSDVDVARVSVIDDNERVSDVDDTDSYEETPRPPSPEFDIEVPHAVVAGNYSLISEPEEQKSVASIRADEDGGYLSVLSEAAMYHALLKSGSITSRGLRQNQDHICNTSKRIMYQDESKPTTVNESDTLCSTTVLPPETSLNEDLKMNGDSVVLMDSTINSCTTRTPAREMDATSDLNESDMKKLEEMRSFESSEDGFHDTLEEMEMMMKLGMDYMTGGQNLEDVDAYSKECEEIQSGVSELDKHLEKNRPEIFEEEVILNIPAKSNIPKLQNCAIKAQTKLQGTRLQAVVSPTVHVKPSPFSPFKMPLKPPVHAVCVKKTPLKPVTPCKKPCNYNKIISPVSAYIHNTPLPSLVTVVKPKSTPRKMKALQFETSTTETIYEAQDRGEENINVSNLQPVLPMVNYKSTLSVKLEHCPKERMPRVAEKMKKLVDTPRPRVIKHEGRVRISPSPKTRLNLDNSNSDAEISVVVGKHVSRTNTLGK